MADPTEPSAGILVTVILTLLTVVGTVLAWARWFNKSTHDTHESRAKTLSDIIKLLTDGQNKLESEIAALRTVQTKQTGEIATLTEKVRQLETQRDALLAENTSHKSEIVALKLGLGERDAKILRLETDIAKAVSDVQVQEALNERLNQRLVAYEKASAAIKP